MANNLAFAALADPTRREVFERLAERPQAVGELAERLPVSRPAVSQHLKVLKEAGLVTDRPEGARRVYQIDPAGLGQIRAWLDRFWDEALEAFKAEVERDADEEADEKMGDPA
jgi:DNA-binding transcriptional ArsR family regulator